MALKPVEGKLFQALDKLPLDEIKPAYTRQIPGETSLQNIPKKFGNGTGFLSALDKFLKKSELGKYPKEYNARVHGPYYPGTYYGPAASFMETKLVDVPKWFMSRDRSFLGLSRFFSRANERHAKYH